MTRIQVDKAQCSNGKTKKQILYLQIIFVSVLTQAYNPEMQRFLNADSVISGANGAIEGYSLFSYCFNNAVAFADSTGHFAESILNPQWLSIYESVSSMGPEGILLGLGVLFVGCVATAIASSPSGQTYTDAVSAPAPAPAIPTPRAKNKEEVITELASAVKVAEPKKSTVIYRYGEASPGNLTPKQKDFDGLSFSTIPKPGCVMTTIEALNATGVVYAVQDGATHVSVKPVGAPVQAWIDQGSNSIWTGAVRSVVFKWDGVG